MIRAPEQVVRSVGAVAVLTLWGSLFMLIVRNQDDLRIIGRLGPGATTAIAVGSLLLGLYFLALWNSSRRNGRELVRADADGVVIHTILQTKHLSPVAVDGFCVVRRQGRDLLTVTAGGKTVATTILRPDQMSWREAAEQLNAWLMSTAQR